MALQASSLQLFLAVGALALAACSSTPAPVDRPLDADPPLSDSSPPAKKNAELDQGEALVKGGKFAEAIPHLKAALAADPKSANAAFYLGLSTEQTGGDKAEAEHLYRQALTFDPTLSEAAQNLAAMFLTDPPRPDDAISVLEPALKSAPDDAALNANLGFAYGLKGDVDRASAAYERSLKKESTVQTEFAYGTMLFENKRPDAAVAHLLKAAAGLNDDPASLATIARMLGPGKAFDDCVRLLDRAITLKPGVAELFVRRGVCKHELTREKDAADDYLLAIKADPKFQAAHYYLGMSLIAQGKKPEGRRELKKAVDLGKETSIGKQAQQKLDGK